MVSAVHHTSAYTHPLLNLIILLPLCGAAVLGGGSLLSSSKEKGLSEKTVALIGSTGPFLAALISFFLLSQGHVFHNTLWTWLNTPETTLRMGLRFDALSGLMAAMVTGIGFLIHLFSISYMQKDRGFARYFAYLNLFLTAMLLLLLSDNMVGMFMGWEGVGVCSYLLIGFWFKDAQKAAAGSKAFIVNRVGDFGLILGIFFLFLEVHSFQFTEIETLITQVSPLRLTAIALLLLIGALGKSAQIPLHVWLPDAMAGPTPVSALIHAATMVTAGVYMISRMNFLYNLTPSVSQLIIFIGSITALVAACIALVQTDIKKVLAYSTVSQLGYMFMAVGAGAYVAGIFHVFTHAFFKAALFLGAGAIIHCLHHEQDLLKMGGLRSKLKVTHAVMLVSCLAISGIPPFAGFFSKDEILWSLWTGGHYVFWGMGLVTAGLTAFYMFRLYFLAFGGEYRGQEEIHSEPLLMKLPLGILSIGAVFAGLLGLPEVLGAPNWFNHHLHNVLGGHHSEASASMAIILMVVSVLVASAGIAFAAKKFKSGPSESKLPTALKTVFEAKFGFDALYQMVFVRPLFQKAALGREVIDGLLIDGIITTFIPKTYYVIGLCLRSLQFGKVRAYAHYMLFGIILLAYIYFMLHFPGVFQL